MPHNPEFTTTSPTSTVQHHPPATTLGQILRHVGAVVEELGTAANDTTAAVPARRLVAEVLDALDGARIVHRHVVPGPDDPPILSYRTLGAIASKTIRADIVLDRSTIAGLNRRIEDLRSSPEPPQIGDSDKGTTVEQACAKVA